MKTVEISPLPEGAMVRGRLYDDPDTIYVLGDILEVELANGIHVDLEWDEDYEPMPFKITIWIGWFGNDIAVVYTKTHTNAAKVVSKLAMKYDGVSQDEIEDMINKGTIEEWR